MSQKDFVTMQLSARAARAQGDFKKAKDLYVILTKRHPQKPDLWVDYGETLAAAGDWLDATQAFRRSTQIKPDYALAWHNLGHLLNVLRQDQDAIEAVQTALRLDPKMAVAWLTLGTVLHRQGQDQAACDAFDKAVAIKPDYSAAYNNKGLIFQKNLHYVEALQLFLQALEYDVNDPGIHNNMGSVLNMMGQVQGALGCFDRALNLDPDHVDALCNKGNALAGQGRIDEALGYYQRAISVNPNFYEAYSNFMFYLLHKDGTTLQDVLSAHKNWARQLEKPLKSQQFDHGKTDRTPDRPLKVGFVSGDFRNHPVFYFTILTLQALARDPQFELFAYANQHESDDCTPRARDCFQTWHNITAQSDETVAAQIHADKIDILIDLSGHNDRHRLLVFARKPAPVQATWAGYMATTGLDSIDWLIGDAVQTPAADQEFYTEKLYQLPDAFIAYMPATYAPPVVETLPFEKNHVITFGSFNKPAKMSARAIAVWSDVLDQVPGSRLMLKFYGLADPAVAELLIAQFAAHGIARGRLILEGPAKHAALLQTYADQIDIALDSMPYTGSTTTLEALWMGVPVIARHGDIFPARHSSAYLSAIGMTDWIAENDADFVAKAVALAHDIPLLKDCRKNLRDQMAASPLCDADRFAGHFKTALRTLWQDFCGAAIDRK